MKKILQRLQTYWWLKKNLSKFWLSFLSEFLLITYYISHDTSKKFKALIYDNQNFYKQSCWQKSIGINLYVQYDLNSWLYQEKPEICEVQGLEI